MLPFFKKRKGLMALLCTVVVLGGAVLLHRHYALNDLAPTDRILPVPVVYGGAAGEGLTRRTEIRFSGRRQAEVEDVFALQNSLQQAQAYTLVYPVLPATQENLGESCELRVNGTLCTEYATADTLRFSYGADLTPLEDGTWFRALFPEGLEQWAPGNRKGSRAADCVRYYLCKCTVAPGERLELRVSFRYDPTAVFRFCASYHEATVVSHSLTLSGTDTVSLGGSLLSGQQLADGVLELDPTRKDDTLTSRAYLYR